MSLCLWVCDVQERLFPKIDKGAELLETLQFLVSAFQKLNLPIIVTEQYPQGLGPTIQALKTLLPATQKYHAKTTFSGAQTIDSKIKKVVLAGIEAHICIFQTAIDLVKSGVEVIICADAVSSRRGLDCKVALDALRHEKVSIWTAEMVLYHLIGDASKEVFSELLPLIKKRG